MALQPGPYLLDHTDPCSSVGTLAIYALSLDEDAEDMGHSFGCDLQGLNTVKDPGFSCLVTPLCQPPKASDHQMRRKMTALWEAPEPFPNEQGIRTWIQSTTLPSGAVLAINTDDIGQILGNI